MNTAVELGRMVQAATCIRGMARCSRELSANIEATNQGNGLVGGLDKRSPAWRRAQLERIQFAVQVRASLPEETKKVGLEIKLLRDIDPQMSGLFSGFMRLEVKSLVEERR